MTFKQLALITLLATPLSTLAAITIRLAILADIPQLEALDREVNYDFFKPLFVNHPLQPLGTDPDTHIEKEIVDEVATFAQYCAAENNERIHVAYDNQTAAGLIAYHLEDDRIIIDYFYIRSAYRRIGVGKQLLYATLAEFPHAAKCVLLTSDNNTAACSFYEKNGFNQIPLDTKYLQTGGIAEYLDNNPHYRGLFIAYERNLQN